MATEIAPCFPKEIEADFPSKVPPVLPDRPRLAPPDVEVLSQTRSVCPICLSVVDADVGVQDGAVSMFKTCPQHGPSRGKVSPDVAFYKKVMNRPPLRRMPFKTLIIPATHRCNLNCALCFVPKRDRDNLTLDGIKAIIDSFPGPQIALSGGEPTLREDLPELIRHIRSTGRKALLFTNAIKLAEKDYVDRLTEAGLQHVLFSFNGFNDKIYEVINRQPLLDEKCKALDNCARAGLDVILSPTIFRDLNEAEMGPLIDLCLQYAPCVSELRIRGACRVGRHTVFAPLSTVELLRLVADALGRTVSDFVQELDPSSCYHSAIQFNLFCAFRSGMKKRDLVAWNSGQYRLSLSWEEARADLEQKVRAKAGGFLPPALFASKYKLLQINTWGWPDTSNLDFHEIWSHGVCHLYDNRVPMNFCEAVLRADSL